MNVDDLLFEPITSNPSGMGTAQHSISKSPNCMWVEIIRSSLKQNFINLANEVIDHAARDFPSLIDVRSNKAPIPKKCLNLVDITDRYYEGQSEIWIARPSIMFPTKLYFEGTFGFLKYYRMPQSAKVGAKKGFFYWIDTDQGQIAMLDLGILCAHTNISAYHCFTNENDANEYYRS